MTLDHKDSPSNLHTRNQISHIPTCVGLLLILSDVFSVIFSQLMAERSMIFLSNYFTSGEMLVPSHHLNIHENLFLILGIILTGILFNKGFYTTRTPWWSQVQYITRILFFSVIIHGFLSFALKFYEPRLFIILCWGFLFSLMIFFRIAIYKMARFFTAWKVPTVIISQESTSEDLLYAFNSDISTGYSVHTIFIRNPEDINNFDVSNLSPEQQKIKICYGQEDHRSYIENHPNNFYIISLDMFRDTSRDDIIRTLNDANIPYAIVPTLSRANLYQMEPKYFFGHDVVMLYVRNSDTEILRTSLAMMTKRCLDLFVSSLALIIVAPIILILAICLKIEGQNGSIFYGGRRIGKNGKKFSCWKLRSMEPNSDHLLTDYLDKNPDLKADWEKYRKLPHDPRVTTKTAKIIRKASLDELPQIWNIFVGDMSLVGPRPIVEEELSYFEEDTFKEYLSIRPGLTGLWQVSGRNNTSFKRRIYWDSWYVRNWSLWGDIVILIKTPIVLLTRKGAS